jgi:hypothetical protein
MVFTPTKQEANEMALNSSLKQECQVLHGDIPQKQREVTLKVELLVVVLCHQLLYFFSAGFS